MGTELIIAFVMAVTNLFGAIGDKTSALGETYRVTCETWGGEYVNDNPTFYQSWSCVGGTPPKEVRQ